MTNLLIRRFIKNADRISDPAVRKAYGTLSSVIGVLCNLLLFALKLVTGLLANSVSIVSDAFNNLSDSAGSIVTLYGYKVAAKPADRDHPFGHGRMEYLTAFVLASLILLVGLELLRDSVDKILHPVQVQFRLAALLTLIFSIVLKLWLSLFNGKIGKKINSGVLRATAADSRNDVIATLAVLIALLVSPYTKLPVDGVMGAAVSLFILKSGFDIIRDTVDDLLGKPASSELCDHIEQIITADEHILGVHDLILHSYGPGNTIGSCHAEVRSDEDILVIHDIIDCLERQIGDELNIVMTIHLDPVELDNEVVNKLRAMVRTIINEIDERLSFHDFRVVSGETHTNIIFDVVLPCDTTLTEAEIKSRIDAELQKQDPCYYTVITFDRLYTEHIQK